MRDRPHIERIVLHFSGGLAPLEVTIDKQVSAIYVRVCEGKVVRTIEEQAGKVMVDVDAAGNLLGFEVLGACRGQLRFVGAKYAPAIESETFGQLESLLEVV